MNGNLESADNVVSLFSAAKKDAEKVEKAKAEANTGENFAEVMRRNAEVQERLRKERSKANQLVLRSYRIKN